MHQSKTREAYFDPNEALEIEEFISLKEVWLKACNHPSWDYSYPMQVMRTLLEEIQNYDESSQTCDDMQIFLFTIKEKVESLLNSLKEEKR